MIRYLIACALLLAAPLAAQSTFPDWQAYPTLARVEAMDTRGGDIWSVSGGGAFRYSPQTGETESFTVIQGLFGRSARAVATPEGTNAVWIGYSSGTLDRLNASTGEVTRFRDISRAVRFSQRGINRIVAAGERLYLATDFGVVVFDPAGGIVRETYSRFATLSSATPAYDVSVVGDRIYVATAEGLVRSTLDGRNLQDPAAWTLEAGLGNRTVFSVEAFVGRLYAGTSADLYVQQAGSFAWSRSNVTGESVRTLERRGDTQLIGVERFGLVQIDAAGATRLVRSGVPSDPVDVVAIGDALWLGARGSGLLRGTVGADAFTVQETIVPQGPGTDVFTDLAFEPDGTLWAAGNDVGLFRLSTQREWTRISDPAATGRDQDDVFEVAVGPSGEVWAGTQGNGVFLRTPEGEVEQFDRANSTLRTAVSSSPDFLIVEGVDVDQAGALWVTNKNTSRALQTRQPDGTWYSLPNPTGDGIRSTYDAYIDLMVDSFGQKWMLLQSELDGAVGRGVVVYDTGSTPTDPSDDAFRLFTEGNAPQGLPSNTARAITEDRQGRIWVATDRGVAFLLSNGITARDPSAQFNWPGDTNIGRFPLENVNATAIAIDLGGGIWVGSSEGIFVLRETAGQFPLVARYTVENAPLPSNRIVALEADPATGTMFVATDAGLVSFSGTPQAPALEAGDLRVHPNPARASDLSGAGVTIGGLVAEAQIRIVTADGRIVWRDDSRGGSYVWDGRDLRGEAVPSGVYVVVAVGADGEGASYGRVAILR